MKPKSPQNFPASPCKLISEAENDRAIKLSEWELSLRFLSGDQWVDYNEGKKAVERIRSVPGQTQLTINLLLNLYRSVVSMLDVDYPAAAVLPASGSSEDTVKAQASEMFLRYFWQSARVREKLNEAEGWAAACGDAALHLYYDPGKEQLALEAISPYDLYAEPDAECEDQVSWWAIRRYYEKHELAQAYPAFKKEILEATTESRQKSIGEKVPEGRIEVFEFYWKDGRHAITMNDTYLYHGHSDVEGIYFLPYTKLPGRLRGLGLIAPLLHLQWYFNKARSQVIDNVELMANPKWLIPRSAGIPNNAFINRAGEKIYYNIAGGTPTQLTGAPIPEYVLTHIKQTEMDMMSVSGIHSTALGKRAVGVTSGKAIDALTEQSTAQLGHTKTNIANVVQRIARDALILAKKFMPEQQMVRMLDATGAVIFKELKRTDLVDAPEVFIEAGTLFQTDAEARERRVLDRLERGLITPEQAIDQLSFRQGGLDKVAEKVQALSHAGDMLQAVLRNHPIEIFASDDLVAFRRVFSEYMRTDEFYEQHPEIQNYIADIIAAIDTWGAGPEAYMQQRLMNKVWPVQFMPTMTPQEQAGGLAVTESSAGQQQVAGEQARVLDKAQQVDRMDAGVDAMRPPMRARA